jgi:hypothetical protein
MDTFERLHFVSTSQLMRILNCPRRTANYITKTHLIEPRFVRRISTPRGEDDVLTLTRFKEKSYFTLAHDLEVSWQMIFSSEPPAGVKVIALSRDPERIEIRTSKRPYTPDYFLGLEGENLDEHGRKKTCFYFCEVTKARPGTHGTRDLIEKCERYNDFFETGQFPDWLKKRFGYEKRDFRVLFSFPTTERALNFVADLAQRDFPKKGKFFAASESGIRGGKDFVGFYDRTWYSPKDHPTLHTLLEHI